MAAHLYSIPTLKSRCGELLIKKLSPENAAEYFNKAYLTGFEDLMEAASNVFYYNCSEVFQSNGWKEVLKSPSKDQAIEQLIRHLSSPIE